MRTQILVLITHVKSRALWYVCVILMLGRQTDSWCSLQSSETKTEKDWKATQSQLLASTHPLAIPMHIQTQKYQVRDTTLFDAIESKFPCLCCNYHFFPSKHFSFIFPHNRDYMFTYIILHKDFSLPDERLTTWSKNYCLLCSVPKTFTFHVKANLLGVSRVIIPPLTSTQHPNQENIHSEALFYMVCYSYKPWSFF